MFPVCILCDSIIIFRSLNVRSLVAMRSSTKKTTILFLSTLIVICCLIHYFKNYGHNTQLKTGSLFTSVVKSSSNTLYNVQVIDTNETVNQTFACRKTKTLLNHFSAIICLHDKRKDLYVSHSYLDKDSIWEEQHVTRILRLLLRNPHLDFIDIGANIGSYTMYVAALGRFCLAIDCFEPNIRRIQRAAQLMNVQNRVVLVQNALFTESGKILRLSYDARNIGGQEINAIYHLNQTDQTDPYLVRTIKFDEVAPILRARGVRGVIMKVDIEGSESFIAEGGSKIFDEFDIPYIQMEWFKVRHIANRVKILFNFFLTRDYIPMTFECRVLDTAHHLSWPNDFSWVKRNVSNIC